MLVWWSLHRFDFAQSEMIDFFNASADNANVRQQCELIELLNFLCYKELSSELVWVVASWKMPQT